MYLNHLASGCGCIWNSHDPSTQLGNCYGGRCLGEGWSRGVFCGIAALLLQLLPLLLMPC